jgi:general secretion pathway protein K
MQSPPLLELAPMNRLSSQRGSAIIIALFVTSLAVIAAVNMLARGSIETRRTMLMLNADQASLYAQGSVEWAKELLKNNLKQQKTGRLVDIFPMQTTDTINGSKIVSSIEDMQAYFNLNNLSNLDYQKNLLRMMAAVDPQLKLSTMMHIVAAATQWINSAKDDTLDAYYGKLTPPYRSPHKPMASVSELRLVRGMTPEIYQALLPFVTVLPVTTAINVNTAPAIVLRSLSSTLSAIAAQQIVQRRTTSPFLDTQSFIAFDVIKNNPVSADQVTVTSSYFLLKTSVTVGQQQTILYTLLSREMKDSKPQVTALWQTKGTL